MEIRTAEDKQKSIQMGLEKIKWLVGQRRTVIKQSTGVDAGVYDILDFTEYDEPENNYKGMREGTVDPFTTLGYVTVQLSGTKKYFKQPIQLFVTNWLGNTSISTKKTDGKFISCYFFSTER